VTIPFNRPFLTGKELEYIRLAHQGGWLAGNGLYTRKCQDWLQSCLRAPKALLTHSCTGALEMSAILAEITPGDEVILPSFTFVSTANAFVLRGAIPVFVDIKADTKNIDPEEVKKALTKKTRAIVAVHYGGVGCEMESLQKIAKSSGALLIEDAAQALFARYQNKPLGTWGDLATLSFHETKNVISGEGGALLVNNSKLSKRSEIIWEKGTNRAEFARGEVNKYSWVDIGSSFLPSDILAAFLYAQLENAEDITRKRVEIWDSYHSKLEDLEKEGSIQRPHIPESCQHNAHCYSLLLPDLAKRTAFIKAMREKGIHTAFHYVPLHSSPAGKKYGRNVGDLKVTDDISSRLVRLPLWLGVEKEVDRIVSTMREVL